MDYKHCEAVNGEQTLRTCGASARRSSLTLGGRSFRDNCLFPEWISSYVIQLGNNCRL